MAENLIKFKRPAARKANQIILSGPQDQVDQLLGSVKQIKNQATVLGLYAVDQTTWKVVLLQVPAPPGNDQTDAFNQTLLREAHRAGLREIRTEPNFTVAAPSGPKGNPYNWEGDPYNWEGDPYNWEGDPYNWEGDLTLQAISPKVKEAGTTQAEGHALFTGQSAFQQIRVAANGQRLPGLDSHRGEGVLVGLFDSCPNAQELASLPGGAPAWLHTHPCSTPLPGGPYVDHGLFNASLVNFIAPSAEIHLFQVLTGEMLGDTAWLITAFIEFLNLAAGRPAVANLSLGSLQVGPVRMPAIEGILSEFVRRGGVICAAAGNRGRHASKAAAVPPAQMPASLPYVIAVAAVSQSGIRASFSHSGDIAAPGGETSGAGPDGFDDMVGMGTASPSGYIRMDGGTSFATPLVAGAAALVLSTLTTPSANRWQQVFDRLAASAQAPAGADHLIDTTGLGVGVLQVSLAN